MRAHFVELAEQRQFKVIDMPSDGNCGLHAVVHQLSLQGRLVDQKSLRDQAVCYLRTHPKLMNESFLLRHEYSNVDSYLTQQARDGQWVDEIMMRAVCACIERKITILHDNGHETILDLDTLEPHRPVTDPSSSQRPIYIGLISETHYVSLLKMEDRQDTPMESEPEGISALNTPCLKKTVQIVFIRTFSNVDQL